MTDEFEEMLNDQNTPEASVAAVAVQVIGELHRMLMEGFQHDDKSLKMVMGTVAFLTSVLDGKVANPVHLGEGFVNACTAVDQSMMDEVDRCQHFLAEAIEAQKKAESKALVNELYASWYLRLRDGDSGNVAVSTMGYDPVMVSGEDLDSVMEDLDESLAPPEPEPEESLFDDFDDDVIF